jgi:hypothetical protein
LSSLRDDLQDRLARGRQERSAAKLTWEAIQRIELSGSAEAACQILDQAARAMGCRRVRIDGIAADQSEAAGDPTAEAVSGPSAIFRLSGGRGRWITMELAVGTETPLAADIVLRYMQRLGQALSGRIERLEETAEDERLAGTAPADPSRRRDRSDEEVPAISPSVSSAPRRIGRIAALLGRVGAGGLAVRVAGPTAHRPAADRLAGPHSPARP